MSLKRRRGKIWEIKQQQREREREGEREGGRKSEGERDIIKC